MQLIKLDLFIYRVNIYIDPLHDVMKIYLRPDHVLAPQGEGNLYRLLNTESSCVQYGGCEKNVCDINDIMHIRLEFLLLTIVWFLKKRQI